MSTKKKNKIWMAQKTFRDSDYVPLLWRLTLIYRKQGCQAIFIADK